MCYKVSVSEHLSDDSYVFLVTTKEYTIQKVPSSTDFACNIYVNFILTVSARNLDFVKMRDIKNALIIIIMQNIIIVRKCFLILRFVCLS